MAYIEKIQIRKDAEFDLADGDELINFRDGDVAGTTWSLTILRRGPKLAGS